MRDAGIVAIKGTGHEGWKGALPYPDCSPALVSVAVAYAGHMPYTDKPEKLVENGWTRQGWRWDPAAYCEEQSVAPDQLTCVTNNAPGMGYELSDNSVASPLASIHPGESSGENLGNAWTTPYVAATVALLRSENLAANLTATEVMDLIHQSGATIMDTRSCTHATGAAEPDGWFYADADFFGIDLAAPEFTSEDQLSQRETQQLQYPWAYSCSDSVSPDTARFHLDNIPDYSNRRLDVGAAVRKAMERTGTN